MWSTVYTVYSMYTVLALLYTRTVLSSDSQASNNPDPSIQEDKLCNNSRVDQSQTISITHKDGDFQVEAGRAEHSGVVAWAQLTNNQTKSGWMYLEISTNDSFPDHIQAMAAGYAEGYLTRNLIYEHYKEFILKDICLTDHFCLWMRKHFKANQQWVDSMATERKKEDPYWHMINLYYTQIRGLQSGWSAKTLEEEDSLPADFDVEYGFHLLNHFPDLWDYQQIFKMETKPELTKPIIRPSCSAIIKPVPDAGELYVGHTSWHSYNAMGYRVLKKYNLPYKMTETSTTTIPGHTLSMSSYAGICTSLDDFVTTSAGLVTTETTLSVFNTTLYSQSNSSSQVFESARAMVANRLATSGDTWTELVGRWNSGTYNNQWMVIDFNKLNDNGTSYEDGLLWVYEQLPGRTWAEDQTSLLRKTGYWGSYNRPFYPEAYQLSGMAEKRDIYADFFSYNNTARAKIMARDEGKIVDEASLTQFMRYNNFKEDEHAVIQGCKGPNPSGSIANRLDLALPDSDCSFADLDPMVKINIPYGAIDMKYTTREMSKRHEFVAVNGPTHGGWMAPFDWSNTTLLEKPSCAPVLKFDFVPEKISWTMDEINKQKKNSN